MYGLLSSIFAGRYGSGNTLPLRYTFSLRASTVSPGRPMIRITSSDTDEPPQSFGRWPTEHDDFPTVYGSR